MTADRDLQHPDITHILRTGEPPQQKYPDDAEDEIEYIKDEMRCDNKREEEMIRNERKATYE